MRQQLIDRLTENYGDYQANLLQKDRQELIDSAGQIAGTAHIFRHMTERNYTEQELDYLLKFQNPLEVVADHWVVSEILPDRMDPDGLDYLIADIVDRQEDLTLFPLAQDKREPDGLRKFLNVDLEKVLPQIMKQKTAFYQTDLQYALDDMRRGIATDDPSKRNFVVIFRESGVECMNERDMMIAGTRSYNTCQFYDKQSREPVLAYSVELLGDGQKGLRGNLYQQDQHRLAKFTERAASPHTDVTLTFSDGAEVRIPVKEDTYETVSGLKYTHGDLLERRNEAEDESRVQSAVYREHERREDMPKGYIGPHVQRLEAQRIQTEADRLVSKLQSLTEPNASDKIHFTAEVSVYFTPLASQEDINLLFAKVRDQVKQPLYIDKTEGKAGISFFMQREERTQNQQRKPSIKAQLAVKPVPGDKPAQKSKNRDAR